MRPVRKESKDAAAYFRDARRSEVMTLASVMVMVQNEERIAYVIGLWSNLLPQLKTIHNC